MTPSGISVIAGAGPFGDSGDNGNALLAKLNTPSGLAVDAENLFMVDNSRIRKYNFNSQIITSITPSFTYSVISLFMSDDDGYLYFAGRACVGRVKPDGTDYTATYNCGDSLSEFYQFIKVDGYMFLADKVNGAIWRVTPDLSDTEQIGGSSGGSVGPSYNGQQADTIPITPSGIAMMDGLLYVTDGFGDVLQLNPVCPGGTILDTSNGQCQVSCFGISAQSTNVCGGHGTCSSGDACSCSVGWTGQQCLEKMCFGEGQNSATVCSGHGSCVAIDTCICVTGYGSANCSEMSCFGVLESDAGVFWTWNV